MNERAQMIESIAKVQVVTEKNTMDMNRKEGNR
jgi:hypothetical protein